MGHATAEAVVKAGLPLVPVTMTGSSRGVAVRDIGVAGIPVEIVGKVRKGQTVGHAWQQRGIHGSSWSNGGASRQGQRLAVSAVGCDGQPTALNPTALSLPWCMCMRACVYAVCCAVQERRQEAMDQVKEKYPNLIVVDYTQPYCVEGALSSRSLHSAVPGHA